MMAWEDEEGREGGEGGRGEGGIKDRAELCTVLKACGWNRSTSLEMENDSVYIYIHNTRSDRGGAGDTVLK